MALTVTPSQPTPGVELWTYDNLDTADSSPTPIEPGGTLPIFCSVQATGTFGGGTVKVQGSNDNTNWVDLKDTGGLAIEITGDGGAQFFSAYRYLRPLITGGSGDDVDVYITLRG